MRGIEEREYRTGRRDSGAEERGCRTGRRGSGPEEREYRTVRRGSGAEERAGRTRQGSGGMGRMAYGTEQRCSAAGKRTYSRERERYVPEERTYGGSHMSPQKAQYWRRAAPERTGRETARRAESRRIADKRRRKSRYKRRERRYKAASFVFLSLLCLGILAAVRGKDSFFANTDFLKALLQRGETADAGTVQAMENGQTFILNPDDYTDQYAENLAELLELNEEAADYVACYPDREKYQSQAIDLTEDISGGGVPLLMQWDKRWGYDSYGDGMIGLAGCGPVCLDMAYLYFTKDTDMTPREMAAFAYDNGYYAEGGTSWSLWTEGVKKLGLYGEELSLDESAMKQAIDNGNVVICSMRPGDFTTTGHFILIRGYDENGFYVNDPNRRSNSERQWDFDTLRYQIKNLWSLGKS